jgi:putative NADPH-quinone reductase
MKVLTVYAHNNPRSFCHGVLEHFTEGLRDAGHTSEVIDLYAIKFDPVFRDRDVASYTAGDIPGDVLELMDMEAQVMNSCRGPLQRWLAARALRGKTPSQIAALIRSRMPKDVLAQQEKVAWADGLAFIAPVHFCSFPAILKGWIDRVWTLDFRVRADLGRLARRCERPDPAAAPPAGPDHDLDDLRQERLRRRHPRRHRQGHRRLGLPLPRHPRRRTRLLLRGDIRHPGAGQAILPAGVPARPRLRKTRPRPSAPRRPGLTGPV